MTSSQFTNPQKNAPVGRFSLMDTSLVMGVLLFSFGWLTTTHVTPWVSWHAELPVPRSLVRWSPDRPQLYDVTVTAGDDRWRDRVGFRTLAVRGATLLRRMAAERGGEQGRTPAPRNNAQFPRPGRSMAMRVEEQRLVERAQRAGLDEGLQQAHAVASAVRPANSASSACTSAGSKRHACTPGASARVASRPRQNR